MERFFSLTVLKGRRYPMFESFMWLIVVAGGPLLLVVLMAYVVVTRRHLGPAERRESDRATDQLYRQDKR